MKNYMHFITLTRRILSLCLRMPSR